MVDFPPDCMVGEHVVVLGRVNIGCAVALGNNVVIHDGTAIGDGVIVGDNAVLGRRPTLGISSTQRAEEHHEGLIIGSGCRIGAAAIVFSGTEIGPETLVGDQALLREGCRVGRRTVIGSSVTVENRVVIGDNVRIQSKAYIPTDTVIEDTVFIAPCVVMTNDNFMGRTERRFALKRGPTIRRGARIGANVTLLPGVEIGAEAFVAAGSLVTKDVPAAKLVMGTPARVIRDVPVEEFAEATS